MTASSGLTKRLCECPGPPAHSTRISDSRARRDPNRAVTTSLPPVPMIRLSGFGGGILESVITLQLMEGVLLGEIIMALQWEHDHELSG
jgi:hypothetical protein